MLAMPGWKGGWRSLPSNCAVTIWLTSAKWNGNVASGRSCERALQLLLSGAMKRYLIPGLGIVDIVTDAKVVPGRAGGAARHRHRQAWVRRLDNAFSPI